MSEIFEIVKLRIVDVSFALVAPNWEVSEAQSQRMFTGNAVKRAVLVDVSRTESFEAEEANPIFDDR